MFDKPRLNKYLEERVGKTNYAWLKIVSSSLPVVSYNFVLVFKRRMIERPFLGLVRDYFGSLNYREAEQFGTFGIFFERTNIEFTGRVFVEIKNEENIFSLTALYNRIYS